MKTGICLITKDCNPDYLKEWVEWHKLIGFDYFFIYDNDSTMSVSKILEKYDDVFVFSIQGQAQQLNAYNDCLAKHKQKQIPVCDWIAFIDDDEFIIPEDGSIKSFLKNVKSSGVVFNWRCFGASKEGFSGTQIEKYINSTPDTFPSNRHVKSAVRPDMVKSFPNPHYALYIKGGAETVLGEKLPIEHPLTKYAVFQKVWINHYYCKSEKEWEQKQQRGRGDSTQFKYSKKQYNEVNDNATEINNYAVRLQKTLISKGKESVMRSVKSKLDLNRMIAFLSININLKKATMIEIGSFMGESTALFAERFEKVIAIDPFKVYDKKSTDIIGKFTEKDWVQTQSKFEQTVQTHPNITHIKKTSDDAVLDITEKVAFVYIDGTHSYEQVKKDIENYAPLITLGGYIGGHDYVKGWSDVIKAVDAVFGAPDYVFGTDGNWVKKIAL